MSHAFALRRISLHGHEVAYRMAGSGEVLLLIHGMAGSSSTWKHVMPALSRRYTVVAPDLIGHGRSGKPPGDYSVGAYATSLRDLLIALGHERASFIGQSFGGGVALQMAYQFPERCERLVLVGSGGLGKEVNAILRGLSLPGARFVLPVGVTRPVHHALTAIGRALAKAGRSPHPALVEIARSYASLTDGKSRKSFMRTLRAVVDRSGQSVTALDRLHLAGAAPTMIMWGDRDPIIPIAHAYAAHALLPESRLEVFPGVGHFPHCERPERFIEVLVDFLAGTRPATLSASHFQRQVRDGTG